MGSKGDDFLDPAICNYGFTMFSPIFGTWELKFNGYYVVDKPNHVING